MKFIALLLLVASSSAIRITCDFRDSVWTVIGRVYTCNVVAIDFSENPTTVTGYSGNHLPGFSTADVGFAFFSLATCGATNLSIIPQGFTKVFPNIVGFFFSGCPITSLQGDELEEYRNLQYYRHYTSNLTQVPGNFFSSTPNLRFASFNFNTIERVGEGLLDNLPRLEAARFLGNRCINEEAVTPEEIKNLKESLRKNC